MGLKRTYPRSSPLRLLWPILLALLLEVPRTETVDGASNVFGKSLEICSLVPMTGWKRDGRCNTDDADQGTHVVCAKMTKEFLDFTKSKGNDLSTPHMKVNFPGLRPGDLWCLCAIRWNEALGAKKAPPVKLGATENSVFKYGITMEDLKEHAINEADVDSLPKS